QTADHKHDAGGAERLCLVNTAAVVVAHLPAMCGVRGKHPAATIARQFKSGIAHRAHGPVEPYVSYLIAPGIDGADAMPGTGVDDLREITLFSDCCRVQRKPAMVGTKIAHQASTPRVESHAFIRRVASSGLASRPALSARRNSSAR